MLFILFMSLVETALGMAVVQCFIPRSALGPGFGKTISATVFFCLLGPVFLMRQLLPAVPTPGPSISAAQAPGFAALALWFAYFVAINYKERAGLQRSLVVLATLAQVAHVVMSARLLTAAFYSPGTDVGYGPHPLPLLVNLVYGTIASGMLLGTVTMAMLIGHWYLVIPGLAIRWLKSGCLVFGISIMLKAGGILFGLMIGAQSDPYGPQGFIDRYVAPTFAIFLARWIVGLVLPGVLCVMAWKAADIRATQSSTGILFPAMILVYLGEMMGCYLTIGFSGLMV